MLDCVWKTARADTVTPIVDAADYFATLRRVMPLAKRQVILIGWDFDQSLRLERGRPTDLGDVPNRLGSLLRYCVWRNPDLHIHILKWDMALPKLFLREGVPVGLFRMLVNRQIHFRLDGARPLGASHHQKIIVIDDGLAFCGGIDVVGDRWDDHLDGDRRRSRAI